MKPEIAVFDKASGAVRYVCAAVHGPNPDDATLGSVMLPAGYDEQTFGWSAADREMIEDPARVEAQQIAAIKSEAERRKMMVLSPGGAKKTEYADKAAEVRTFHTLGGTVTSILAALALMPPSRKAALFPYALADAAAFGDTLEVAIARFADGMAASSAVPAIAATEARACAAIKAAPTVAAKRAATTETIWPA